MHYVHLYKIIMRGTYGVLRDFQKIGLTKTTLIESDV